eukprot:6213569-Lingulodinium_polyedra.AAC.1
MEELGVQHCVRNANNDLLGTAARHQRQANRKGPCLRQMGGSRVLSVESQVTGHCSSQRPLLKSVASAEWPLL